MKRIKNFIANIFVYVSSGFLKLGEFFANIGVNLHIGFDTPTGRKLVKIQEQTEQLVKMQQQQAALQQQKEQKRIMREYDRKDRNKLVAMINAEPKDEK